MGEIAAGIDKLKREEFFFSVSSVPCCSALCETLFVDNAIEKQAARQVLRSMDFIATYVYFYFFQFMRKISRTVFVFFVLSRGIAILILDRVTLVRFDSFIRRRGERSILLASIIALGSPPRTSHTKIAVYYTRSTRTRKTSPKTDPMPWFRIRESPFFICSSLKDRSRHHLMRTTRRSIFISPDFLSWC